MIQKKLALLVLLTIFITGCDTFFGGGGGTIEVYDPYHGTQGLAVTWLENMPPKEIYAGNQFNIGVKVENMGAHDLTDAVLLLTHNPADAKVTNVRKNTNLTGKSSVQKYGESDAIFWDATAAAINEVRSTSFGVMACYEYQTYMFEDICIDPDKYGQKMAEIKSCKSIDVISLESQGAPVVVTMIKPTTVFDSKSDKSGIMQFDLTIQNVGGGDVGIVGPNTWCSAFLDTITDNLDFNVVRISGTFMGQAITCVPSLVYLDDGNEGNVVCQAKWQADKEFETPLYINLGYTYKQVLEPVDVTIKIIPGSLSETQTTDAGKTLNN
ncbi:hypothetical protein A3K72_01265 [Candidatus Woesearchaeota archaeon RBG_13_36_6]|nr:MAG: hypothetical protein A3K72_01265 [Candidatus Woesearchaeota archaeon RBG_13_36_6]